MIAKKEAIKNLLTRNVEQVIEREHLEKALLNGKKLRVKLGIDPTGGNVHIGHAITYWKLREFQDLGHKLVVIIGDFTAQIGDPSDKLNKRPFLAREQVKENLKNYLPQIGKIVDLKKAEIHYNSEWLAKLNFREISELAEIFTAQQMIKRENFRVRWENNQDISLREFMYPLMQGYDSVAVKADLELGGTDQLFNMLAGRKIQPRYGQKPQDIMTMKMLIGVDGRKMSKSWGNVININDSPDEQFGKIMSMRDEMMTDYMELAADMPDELIKKYHQAIEKTERGGKGSTKKHAKLDMAFRVVARYYGEKRAREAMLRWGTIFSEKEVTSVELPELKLNAKKISVLELVLASDVTKSKSDARRLILQNAVSMDEKVKNNPAEIVTFRGGEVLKIGKKNFFRVKVSI